MKYVLGIFFFLEKLSDHNAVLIIPMNQKNNNGLSAVIRFQVNVDKEKKTLYKKGSVKELS